MGFKGKGFFSGLFDPESQHLKQINMAAQDAFGRLRVSEPDTIFDDKHIYAKNDGTNGPLRWHYELSGTGSATYNTNKSMVQLSTGGTASGASSIKQTKKYFPYIPGKSQLVELTHVFGAGEANVSKYAGLFDADNGVYLYEIDGVYGFGIRTDTSGSAVDTLYPQSNWNIDSMDGQGPSEVTIDFSKTQIEAIWFQWLGVGSVYFALIINGKLHPVTIANHANEATDVYMRTSTLPIRYEIKNTGTATGTNTMDTICAALISEGGGDLTGAEFEAGNGATVRTTITAREPILAVRLNTSFESKTNRMLAALKSWGIYAEVKAVFFELVHVADPTTVTGTFNDLNTTVSGVEYSTDVSVVSGGKQTVIECDWAIAGGIGGNAISGAGAGGFNNFRDPYHSIGLNYDGDESELFVVFATSMDTAASAAAQIGWVELQ